MTLYNRDDNSRTQTLRFNLDFDFPCCQNSLLLASKCSKVCYQSDQGERLCGPFSSSNVTHGHFTSL